MLFSMACIVNFVLLVSMPLIKNTFTRMIIVSVMALMISMAVMATAFLNLGSKCY
jgi:hypothetical protein